MIELGAQSWSFHEENVGAPELQREGKNCGSKDITRRVLHPPTYLTITLRLAVLQLTERFYVPSCPDFHSSPLYFYMLPGFQYDFRVSPTVLWIEI